MHVLNSCMVTKQTVQGDNGDIDAQIRKSFDSVTTLALGLFVLYDSFSQLTASNSCHCIACTYPINNIL